MLLPQRGQGDDVLILIDSGKPCRMLQENVPSLTESDEKITDFSFDVGIGTDCAGDLPAEELTVFFAEPVDGDPGGVFVCLKRCGDFSVRDGAAVSCDPRLESFELV